MRGESQGLINVDHVILYPYLLCAVCAPQRKSNSTLTMKYFSGKDQERQEHYSAMNIENTAELSEGER